MVSPTLQTGTVLTRGWERLGQLSIGELRRPSQLFTSLVKGSTPGDTVGGGFFKLESHSPHPPQVNANVLNIPPHGGLAYWESRTARERGQILRTMTERHAQTAGPGAHAEPAPRDTPSAVAMVVLKSGHYY